MSRFFTFGAQLFIDLFALSAAYWLAFLFRYEFDLSLQATKVLFFTWPYVVVFKYMVLTAMGVPKFAWRYIGLEEAKRIVIALAITTSVLAVFRLTLPSSGGYFVFLVIPLGALAADFGLSVLGILSVRVARRMLSEGQERDIRSRSTRVSKRRTLLIGAGRAGVMVAKEVMQNPNLGMQVVGFVDDEAMKIGTIIQGCKVLGDTASLPAIVEEYGVQETVITMASVPGSAIRRILGICKEIQIPVKIIPGLYEILGGAVNLSRIRNVTIEDLLGRDAVELDAAAVARFIADKRVLVTGAGGSIGSELCRQICGFSPKKLILLEQAENALFEIHSELTKMTPSPAVVPVVADICDAERIDQVFAQYRPEVVFHAAAHKHVPMMEWNPGEAIKNNVFGTQCVANAADKHAAHAFVMISTDKAVNPTSIMGATKRVAELYIQGISDRSKTKFVAVRFGNVLGSAGSVVPIFKEQIARGGPITVTHPQMRRYFMTIPEASQLVLEAATMGQGGEIFVLDMGESVKISDLAKDMIRLSGFSPEDIEIIYTGVRPGEKLFEEISTAAEDMTRTRHAKIFIGKIPPVSYDKISQGVRILNQVANTSSSTAIRQALVELVPEMGIPEAAVLPPTHFAEPAHTSGAIVH